MFNEITCMTIEHFLTKDEALEAEHRAIAAEDPKYNVSGGLRPRAAKLRRGSLNAPA